MTTAETTPTEPAGSTPDLGYRNPTNWIITAVCGPVIAFLLVYEVRSIPVWADYVITALVGIWVVLQAGDQLFRARRANRAHDTARSDDQDPADATL